ncbi:hypothetical protein RHGRI_035483 [Rhododendron griersonianum]|uniref:Uncharacterized protein n=1 Tax=Rhododendron griersonianum TaxID=479676 RepID=A0AAV6HNE2_9ERIC|nr:hypothetical protein RHGRI_035483 [Rhododendron griersonianum]
MGNEKREKIKGLKGCQPEEEEEEEDKEVEEKMDKFYALIRSFRDARDRRRNELLKEMEINNNNNKKRKAAEQQTVSSLVPSFRMEDFTQQGEAEFKRTPLKFPPAPSSIKIHEPDDDLLDKESGLDLKLAL